MQKCTTILTVCQLYDSGYSFRDIRSRTKVGFSTISLIRDRFTICGYSLEELEALSESDLIQVFYPEQASKQTHQVKPLPDFEKVHTAVHHGKVHSNLYFQWLLYKEAHPDGYQYTQFKHHYHQWFEEKFGYKDLRMTVNRKPGEMLYIDWAGDRLPLVIDPNDPDNLLEAHLFVTTMGYSSLIFCQAFKDEKSPSFLEGMINALNFYGALPQILKPDNMKTAVNKNTPDQLILNSLFKDLESFYDLVVVPAPPRKPKGKPSVENSVKYVETYVLGRLEGKIFSSFQELNTEILEIVEELNNRTKKDEKRTRRELFETVDLTAMRQLPKDKFQICDYARCRVPDNYHIKFDSHYYSVPYTLYSRKKSRFVLVKADPHEIQICSDNNELICRHKRLYDAYPLYSTEVSHMPDSHKFYAEQQGRDSTYYLGWAKRIGPNMERFIQGVIYNFNHEQQSYNSCAGILHMCDYLDPKIPELAAANCMGRGTIGYSYFKRELNSIKKSQNTEIAEKPVISHENIRGKGYYK